jgi:GNAT superfamily N-acetyltransferase
MLRHAYANASLIGDLPVSRYVDRWGRPGDTAVVALEGATPVGAAWFRLYRADESGFGFVDEQTPELSIAVVPSRRHHGYGSKLLDALLARARESGYATISLSVESDNPARHLYERYGFRPVVETDNNVTMCAELGSPQL